MLVSVDFGLTDEQIADLKEHFPDADPEDFAIRPVEGLEGFYIGRLSCANFIRTPGVEAHEDYDYEIMLMPTPDDPEAYNRLMPANGVADSPEQVDALIGDFLRTKEEHFVVILTPIYKNPAAAGTYGGWRWSRWGQYIGTQDPKTDYLDDDPVIDMVYVFQTWMIEGLPDG